MPVRVGTAFGAWRVAVDGGPARRALVRRFDGSSGGPYGTERLRFHFPRQRRDRHLCLADFVKPRSWVDETGRFDVLPVQLVTVGDTVAAHTARLPIRSVSAEPNR